jgi:Fic family protein
MTAFFAELRGIWTNGDALDAAAFALWRLNWVHSFKNGNGRTARAFAYWCLLRSTRRCFAGVPTVWLSLSLSSLSSSVELFAVFVCRNGHHDRF